MNDKKQITRGWVREILFEKPPDQPFIPRMGVMKSSFEVITVESHERLTNELREQNRVYKEALQFYADPQTYGKHGGSVNRVIADGGATAKAALAGQEGPHGSRT